MLDVLGPESSDFRGYVVYDGELKSIWRPVFEIFSNGSRAEVRFIRGATGIWHVDYFYRVVQQPYSTSEVSGITAEFIARSGLSWIYQGAVAVRVDEFTENDLQARAVPTE